MDIVLYYGPTRLFKPPDALAMQLLGIARAAPPCTSGSAIDRRRTQVIAMLRQGIGTAIKISMPALKFRRQIASAIYRRAAPSSRRTFGDIHRRCSRAARRSIGDVTAMPRWASEIFLLIGHRWSHEDYYIKISFISLKWSPSFLSLMTLSNAERWIFNIVRSLRDREIACSTSDHQGSNFESCVWRAVSFHSSHHPPQEVLLARFSLYMHEGGLKPHSFQRWIRYNNLKLFLFILILWNKLYG